MNDFDYRSIMIHWWYETITFECPYCQKDNIKNRIDEIGYLKAICNQTTKCDFCDSTFDIIWDLYATKWKRFLVQARDYKIKKQYMMYVINLCQSSEVFFSQAIVNKLVDRNINVQNREITWQSRREWLDKQEISKLSDLNSSRKYEKASFRQLKKVFLYQYRNDKTKHNYEWSTQKLEEIQQYFKCIQDTQINKDRNKCIHKSAYRPPYQDVLKYKKLEKALFGLWSYLEIKDSEIVVNNPMLK